MKTADTINIVCSELGITKAELAKRLGMLPSSLYRKLSRESMTLEELQKCLDVLGVSMEFKLQYPDGSVRSSQENYEMLLKKKDLLESELEAIKKAAEFHKNSLRDLRTELNSAVGYAELGRKNEAQSQEYLEKIQQVLTNMELKTAYALGEAAENEPNPKQPINTEMLAGKRVLLVDDNEINREIMREILLDHGLKVEETENGSRAVEAVQTKEPNYYQFILMDIAMPVMDGYEATMRIRKLPNRIRASVPIIALTANAFPEDRERATNVGMDGFLTKPINSAKLLSILAKFQ